MRACTRCGGEVDERFRYCPWCAAPQRLKIVEFFRAHALIRGDRHKALRVSRYLGPRLEERHVRFSVWDESSEQAEATAALSLDEAEAQRLAAFLADSAPQTRPPSRLRLALEELRSVSHYRPYA
jgi:hypothetical protein